MTSYFSNIGSKTFSSSPFQSPPSLGRLLTDTPDEKVIGIERQVPSVVFNRPDGKNGYGLGLREFRQLRPTVVLVQVRFAFHVSKSPASLLRRIGSATETASVP